MKTKRRQELKTNDLAQWLEDMRISFNEWGVYIVVGIAIVAVVAVVLSYRGTAKQDAIRQSYAELSNLSAIAPQGVRKSDDELRQSLAEMGELATLSDDRDFKLDALVRRGEVGLQLAESAEKGIDEEYLGDARDAFEAIREGYQDRAIYFGRALIGLFQIEADEFAVDGDIAHKAKAKRYLEQLRDDERLRGTPYQTKAIDLLNELDSMFTSVSFPSRPVLAAPPPIGGDPAAIPAVTPAASVETAAEPTAGSEPDDIGTSS